MTNGKKSEATLAIVYTDNKFLVEVYKFENIPKILVDLNNSTCFKLNLSERAINWGEDNVFFFDTQHSKSSIVQDFYYLLKLCWYENEKVN